MNTMQTVIDGAAGAVHDLANEGRIAESEALASAVADVEGAERQVIVTMADPYARIRTIIRDEDMRPKDALAVIAEIVGEYESKPQVIIQGVYVISPPDVMHRTSPGSMWSPSYDASTDGPFSPRSYHVGPY